MSETSQTDASPLSVAVRHATEADLPAVVGIYNAAVAGRMSTADLKPVTIESRRQWFREHSPASRPIWVATLKGAVVGWLSLQSFQGRAAYHITAEVSVYVATAHQRKGVGRRLLEEAIARAPSLGLRNLVALVFFHNAPSVALFQEMGFREWGRLPRVADMDGVERDLLILGQRVR